MDVEVTRVEHYACGCTTTRIETSQLERKWLLACGGHQGRLVKVETIMEYQLSATAQPAKG
ncbi:MAG: hypothetical protein KIT08_02915 [Anaerolineales bacterium]|nr:MAG: hypothetical protein KIT08_02915 [Anaerolineales bacterium]